MRKINLLPWREELRRERQRNFLILLAAAAAAAALCVFLISRYYDARISAQDARNSYLTNEIAKLDRRIERIEQLDETRASLLDRKEVIEDLQANRTLMVRLFDQLVRTVPSGIRLTAVTQTGDQIEINGTSQSNARVSTYLRNLESSAVLHEPTLGIIEVDPESDDPQMPFRFRISATVAAPETLDDETAPAEE